MTAPDWLKSRDGALKPGLNSHTVFVFLGGKPQYRLDVCPAAGKYVCNITQTVNGHRFDSDANYANENAAMAGGLEKLKDQLGW